MMEGRDGPLWEDARGAADGCSLDTCDGCGNAHPVARKSSLTRSTVSDAGSATASGRSVEATFKSGGVSVAIRRKAVKQEGRTVSQVRVHLQKRYEDQHGTWQSRNYFFPDELPQLELVLREASEHIAAHDGSRWTSIRESTPSCAKPARKLIMLGRILILVLFAPFFIIWRFAVVTYRLGTLAGAVRWGLGALYATALVRLGWRAAHDSDAATALVITCVLVGLGIYVVGAREVALVALAPDWSLWHARDAPRWGRRLGLAAVRHGAAWMLLTVTTFGLVNHGGLLAFLPLTVSVLQRVPCVIEAIVESFAIGEWEDES